MKKIILLLYYLILNKLPSSYYPLGFIFNSIRVSILSSIIPIGIRTKIQTNVYVGDGSNIEIGSDCQLNENVKLDNVSIGNYVMIAPGVTILGKSHNYTDIKIPMACQGESIKGKTIIEDDVWIGTNSILMPGLRISKGVIIGAGSVVTKDCKEYSVYGGVPAKLISRRK
tara:strand:+ start:5489 stop:5998 length:510 start_codon:yes stop_codon:yes gene_type:complete